MGMLVGLVGVALLAGCSILGGGNARERSTIYDLDPRVAADPSWPRVDWQLSLPGASASRITDSLRIAVRPTPNELQVYKGAVWSRTPTDMIEDAVLRTLEDSGRIAAVARQGSGISAQYKLVLDLRRFESTYTAAGMPPIVRIELNAKLLRSADQQVVATHTFLQENPVASAGIGDVVAAFEQGLETITGDLVGWVLGNGGRKDRAD